MIGMLVFAAAVGLLLLGVHRKLIARIQQRPGPPVWQEVFHALKFSWKETGVPSTASATLFIAVVVIAIGIWSAALFVLLAGESLLILFGIYMLHKLVEHGFGLSSGSPYGKFGGVRSVISAASEVPLFVTVAAVYLVTGSLQIRDIAAYQAVNGPLLLSAALPAAIAMYLVILSKMPFGPFSIVEGKELVSGYKTEHYGVWRAGLMVCDGLKTYVLLAAFVTIFIGAMPLPAMLVAMLGLLATFSFVCALSPMLSPFDSVTVQSLSTAVMLGYMMVLWVVA
jgi:energy-converting hydrogenase A subunit J